MSDTWKQAMSGFNSNEIEPSDNNYDPLPAGDYVLGIAHAEARHTKAGTGIGINIEFDVAEGQHEGRKVFSWYNLQHQNEKAAEIGRREFSGLCRALGIISPDDPSALVGNVVKAKIAIDKKDTTRNVIRGYSGAEGNAAPQPKPQPKAEAPKAETNSGGALPWKR